MYDVEDLRSVSVGDAPGDVVEVVPEAIGQAVCVGGFIGNCPYFFDGVEELWDRFDVDGEGVEIQSPQAVGG